MLHLAGPPFCYETSPSVSPLLLHPHVITLSTSVKDTSLKTLISATARGTAGKLTTMSERLSLPASASPTVLRARSAL